LQLFQAVVTIIQVTCLIQDFNDVSKVKH
jgi:hypothetical protein